MFGSLQHTHMCFHRILLRQQLVSLKLNGTPVETMVFHTCGRLDPEKNRWLILIFIIWDLELSKYFDYLLFPQFFLVYFVFDIIFENYSSNFLVIFNFMTANRCFDEQYPRRWIQVISPVGCLWNDFDNTYCHCIVSIYIMYVNESADRH